MLTIIKKKKIIITTIILIILILSGIIGGCSSTILAPELTKEEQNVVINVHYNLVIGVREFGAKIYSDRLLNALKKTNLFKEVNHLDSLSRTPDLIAKVEDSISGSAIIPIFTLITLGIFPTWTEEEHGNIFSLNFPDSTKQPIKIDCTFKGTTYLGWIAGFMNISKNRISHSPAEHPRYYSQLAYKIITSMKKN